MGNSHGSKPRKKPRLEGPASMTEPLQSPAPALQPVPKTPVPESVTSSFPSTDCQSWDPGTGLQPKSSRPNSLEILIKQAFENYIPEDDIDPKFGVQRQDWLGEPSFELSELPVEPEEDVFK